MSVENWWTGNIVPESGSYEERAELAQWLNELSDGLCMNEQIIDGWKAARCAYLLVEPDSNNDTSRLDYLLQFLKVENVGDTDFCPGVIIQTDDMTVSLGKGMIKERDNLLKDGFNSPNMRRIIDNSIKISKS